MGDSVEIDCEEVRANPWITGLAASPFALIGLLAVAAVASGKALFMVVAPHLFFLGLFATFWARIRCPFPRHVPVRARVDAAGVTIVDGKGERRIESITQGVKVPTLDGAAVRLSRKRGRPDELRLPDEETADGLLRRLGLDVATTTASFRGMSRVYTGMLRMYVSMFGMIGLILIAAGLSALISPIAAGVMGPLGLIAMMLVLLVPSRVEVGADGLLIRWLGRKRFVSHDRIGHVGVQHVGFGQNKWEVVELALSGGEKLRLPMHRIDQDAARILAQRILDARNASRTGGVAPSAMLQRSKRSHREWVKALRNREVTDLRSPAVPKDHLWPIIEDPGTDALERAAAVVALGGELSGADRRRLARVAKVVAAPKLRVVIEEAPDADEEHLVEMLETIESESTRTAG